MLLNSVDRVGNMIEPICRKKRRNGSLVRLDAPRETRSEHCPERCVRRLVRENTFYPLPAQKFSELFHLRGFSASVRPFKDDEFSFVCHNVTIISKPRAFVNREQENAVRCMHRAAKIFELFERTWFIFKNKLHILSGKSSKISLFFTALRFLPVHKP